VAQSGSNVAIAATAVPSVDGSTIVDPGGVLSVGAVPQSKVTGLVTALGLLAPLASPALTGNPTAPTQSAGDNSTKLATTAYADSSFVHKSGDTMTGPLQGFQDKGGQVFNVKAYGAKGDGSTDDTSAIQAAINAAGVAGGTVYFSPGTYEITSTLTLSVQVKLMGAGGISSAISYTGTGDAVSFSSGSYNTVVECDIVISSLYLTCTNASNAGAAIDIVGGSVASILDCRIGGYFQYGIILDQAEIVSIQRCSIQNQMSNGVAGLWLVNGNDHIAGNTNHGFTTMVDVTDCSFNMASAAYSVIDDGGESHRFCHNSFNAGVGWMWLAGVNNLTLEDNDFEDCSGARGIYLFSETQKSSTFVNACNIVNLRGNYFKCGVADYIYVGSVIDVISQGNFFATPTTFKYCYSHMSDTARFIGIGDNLIGTSSYADGLATYDTRVRQNISVVGGTVSAAGYKTFEGSNAKQGVATLSGGSVVVSNTSVTATSRIILTAQSLGTVTAPKALAVTARSAGTSFTITSADATDTSIVAYEIFEVG
jgi:hypothetical protein